MGEYDDQEMGGSAFQKRSTNDFEPAPSGVKMGAARAEKPLPMKPKKLFRAAASGCNRGAEGSAIIDYSGRVVVYRYVAGCSSAFGRDRLLNLKQLLLDLPDTGPPIDRFWFDQLEDEPITFWRTRSYCNRIRMGSEIGCLHNWVAVRSSSDAASRPDCRGQNGDSFV